MFTALALLGLFALLAFAGITGIGVYDSRDTRFSLRLEPFNRSERLHENLVASGRRRRRG